MDPTHVIVTFDKINGKKVNFSSTLKAPFHMLDISTEMTIKTIKIGEKVALYGSCLKPVDGHYVKEYLHLRKGIHRSEPFKLLTLHADIVS